MLTSGHLEGNVFCCIPLQRFVFHFVWFSLILYSVSFLYFVFRPWEAIPKLWDRDPNQLFYLPFLLLMIFGCVIYTCKKFCDGISEVGTKRLKAWCIRSLNLQIIPKKMEHYRNICGVWVFNSALFTGRYWQEERNIKVTVVVLEIYVFLQLRKLYKQIKHGSPGDWQADWSPPNGLRSMQTGDFVQIDRSPDNQPTGLFVSLPAPNHELASDLPSYDEAIDLQQQSVLEPPTVDDQPPAYNALFEVSESRASFTQH